MTPTRTALLTAAISSAFLLAACNNAEAFVDAPTGSTAASPATKPASNRWIADVGAITDADAGEGRRAAIRRRLDALGIAWHDAPFKADGQDGVNLLADVSGAADAPLLLIGAHSDQVTKGQGATDNASGSATVLALAQRLKDKPLANHRVAVAFWDLEEKGLLGSKAFVAAKDSPKPALYVNFDVFGWGDTVWLMSPQADSPLVRASADAARAQGLALTSGDKYPPTDHLPFLEAGWPAVSYSMVGQDEIKLILDMYDGKQTTTVPRVMQVIHSDQDTLAQIDAAATARGVDAVEAALRAWDAGSEGNAAAP
jgi:aminopeptidase S